MAHSSVHGVRLGARGVALIGRVVPAAAAAHPSPSSCLALRAPAAAAAAAAAGSCQPQARLASFLSSSQSMARRGSVAPGRNPAGALATRTLFTRRKPRPVRNAVVWALLAFGATFGIAYHLDSRSAVHRWIAMPVLHTVLDPETAQKLAVKLLSLGIMPRDMGVDEDVLETSIAGMTIKNPIGLAAGFDKQGEAIDGLLNLGFGIVEIGSVTPEPQPGNDLPRYFRLCADRGAINRFGFNSDGHFVVMGRLKDRIQSWLLRSSALAHSRVPLPAEGSKGHQLLEQASLETVLASEHVPRSLRPGQLLAINLGKNKGSPEGSVDDYVKGVQTLGPWADVLVVNISSPNTPGLRGMQRKGVLSELISKVTEARDALPSRGAKKTPVFVKIAPDLNTVELHDIADAALRAGIEGLIVSNTTVKRPESLLSPPEVSSETGGLSGAPLKPIALSALQTVRQRVGDKMSIIGCGGIFSGQDALDFARAGADAVELYTSFGYEGVGHPRRVKDELTSLLRAEGTTWKASIGRGLTQPADSQPKLPSNERQTDRAGGLQERFGESVASVKGELEEWRGLLGMAGAKVSSGISRNSGTGRAPDAMADVPHGPPKTAAPLFRPDPSDTEYVSLLDRVHEALGVDQSSASATATGKGANTVSEDMTETEALRGRLGMALQDPSVAPAAAVTGTTEHATVPDGTIPTGGLLAPIPKERSMTDVAARGQAQRVGAGGAAANVGRVGMGGKSEFNAVDSRRVV